MRRLSPKFFASLFGAFLGLTLLKFGNPPIMERWVETPRNIYEFVLGFPWPIIWAYWLLALVAGCGLLTARWAFQAPRWLIALPLVWLAWQFLAAVQAVDDQLATATFKHFGACVVCFYLGYFCLSRQPRLGLFWIGLLVAFLLVLAAGWSQHFGGLEQTRKYFYTYLYPQLKEVPPGYLKKISSNRIFATLFYPNALAGALLLFLPGMLTLLWRAERWFTAGARRFLSGVVGLGGLGCLFWSGSKGGWLLMLVLGLVVLLHLPFDRRLKAAGAVVVVLVGLAGFFIRYSAFFEKGATSVSARFDY